MIKTKKNNTTVRTFTSISDLVNYIKTKENCKAYKDFMNDNGFLFFHSDTVGHKEFCGTETWEEAEELLLHGWKHGAREIKRLLDTKQIYGVETKQKNVYDVAGFQCSVPRYLQGIPTNMVNKKNISQKNKVITINKCIAYASKIKQTEIMSQAVKTLQLVNRLEKQGYRVNLNIIFGTYKWSYKYLYKVCIKPSSQRLNIKQIAFPLVHPSMLRRVMMMVMEKEEEIELKEMYKGYGYPMKEEVIKQYCNKGELLINSFVYEKEILNIETYKV